MGDIIATLRFYSTREKLGAPDLFSEAADEIERLRAALAPPEPLPEDVEALTKKLRKFFKETTIGVYRELAKLVLADRQHAVEAAQSRCRDIMETVTSLCASKCNSECCEGTCECRAPLREFVSDAAR